MATINLNSSINVRDFGGKTTEKAWFLSVEYSDNLVEVITEDGLDADHVCTIKLQNFFTGAAYLLNAEFNNAIDPEFGTIRAGRRAEAFMNKIQAHGSVNLKNWTRIN